MNDIFMNFKYQNHFLNCICFIHRRPKLKILGFSFFHFYEKVQCNVTYQCNVTNNELDYTKRDTSLTADGGVVLQRFEFIMVCIPYSVPNTCTWLFSEFESGDLEINVPWRRRCGRNSAASELIWSFKLSSSILRRN